MSAPSDKKLMNEVLPKPVIAPRGSPRDRVLRHMRDALAAGASVALLTGCPFAVVDPLPQPALCRSQGGEKLLTAKVTVMTFDSGPPDYVVKFDFKENAGIRLNDPVTVTNGTLVNANMGGLGYRVTPANGATTFDLLIPADCDDGATALRKLGIRVVVDVAAMTATVTEVPAP